MFNPDSWLEAEPPGDAHTRHPARWFLTTCLATVFVWELWWVLQLCKTKAYAIDEYNYVHRAWVFISSLEGALGQVLRGEAFVTSIAYALPVWLGSPDPAKMIYVRLSTFPILLAIILLMGWITSRGRRDILILGVLLSGSLCLSSKKFAWYTTEVRPDQIALLMVLISVALLYSSLLSPRGRSFLAGLLLFVGCFASKKAVFYGAVFAPVFLLDLVALLRGRRTILPSPIAFASGFCLGGGLLLMLLLQQGALPTFWKGYYTRAAEHEAFYPKKSLVKNITVHLRQSWILWGFGLAGICLALVRIQQRFRLRRELDRDLLIVLLFCSTWASYLVQKAAYSYSMMPGIALLTILAARAALVLFNRITEPHGRATLKTSLVAASLLVGFGATAAPRLIPSSRNAPQIAVQRALHAMVGIDEPVYDMSATYVYRPAGHRFAFVDLSRRKKYRKTLVKEVPESLRRNQVMFFVYDKRFNGWVRTSLGRWILKHYQRYNNDLYVWGRKWALKNVRRGVRFNALKKGQYFVYPSEAVRAGDLSIDGKPISRPIFPLDAGIHRVRYVEDSTDPIQALFVIWLPANGEVWNPNRKAPKRSLGQYILPK